MSSFRPVEDITEEDLENVAVTVRDKIYDKVLVSYDYWDSGALVLFVNCVWPHTPDHLTRAEWALKWGHRCNGKGRRLAAGILIGRGFRGGRVVSGGGRRPV